MKDEKGLKINAFGDVIWKLNFTSDSDFFIREFKANLKFLTDKEKKVTGFTINGTEMKKVK